MEITNRRAARILLIDPGGRVLLLSGIDRTLPDDPPFWFTVGGAVEAGETLEAAAYREIEEETGLQITDLGPVVHQRQARWVFEGTRYEQSEVYYLVRTEKFNPAGEGLTELERATHRGHRWWSVDEVRSARERIYPEGLADLLEGLANS